MDGGSNRVGAATTVTPQAYRDGMAHVAGHVHIVTTAGPAGATGFTASAVTSISDDPPTLLFCLNRRSANGPVIEANGVFAVNTLRAEALDLAEVFAGRRGLAGAARFGVGRWSALATSAPVLEGALAVFDCRLLEARPVATHTLFIGRVEAVRSGPAGPALVYFDRSYRTVPG